MKYYLINALNEKEKCTESEANFFLTDKQINSLYNFKQSDRKLIKFKINSNMNLIYSYVVVER